MIVCLLLGAAVMLLIVMFALLMMIVLIWLVLMLLNDSAVDGPAHTVGQHAHTVEVDDARAVGNRGRAVGV